MPDDKALCRPPPEPRRMLAPAGVAEATWALGQPTGEEVVGPPVPVRKQTLARGAVPVAAAAREEQAQLAAADEEALRHLPTELQHTLGPPGAAGPRCTREIAAIVCVILLSPLPNGEELGMNAVPVS
ncbi:UNVERIFIED_CONTAM: hypothetical protein K2H54_038811 [Gekko kuhli]